MHTTLALITCIGAGAVGGVFFAFSAFVMKALAQLPPSHGVAAMQRINVVVLNPVFLGVFMGTALLAAGCGVAAFFPWDALRSQLLLAAGILYLWGTFCVTVRFNVPMNERLAGLDNTSPGAAGYWSEYVRGWTFWNHVRTAASLASAACGAASLAV